jgi:hypothetical protein
MIPTYLTKAHYVIILNVGNFSLFYLDVKPSVKKEEKKEPIMKKEEEPTPKKSTSRTRLKAKVEEETPVRKRQPRRPSTRSSAPKRAKKNSTDDEVPQPPEYDVANIPLPSHSETSSVLSIDLTLDDD